MRKMDVLEDILLKDVTVSDFWGMIRKINGKRKGCTFPVLKCGDNDAVTNAEKAEALFEAFCQST